MVLLISGDWRAALGCGVRVVLVCSRRVSGPSPLHGTIVNNVDTDSSKQAFNTRVGRECLA